MGSSSYGESKMTWVRWLRRHNNDLIIKNSIFTPTEMEDDKNARWTRKTFQMFLCKTRAWLQFLLTELLCTQHYWEKSTSMSLLLTSKSFLCGSSFVILGIWSWRWKNSRSQGNLSIFLHASVDPWTWIPERKWWAISLIPFDVPMINEVQGASTGIFFYCVLVLMALNEEFYGVLFVSHFTTVPELCCWCCCCFADPLTKNQANSAAGNWKRAKTTVTWVL